MVFISVLLLFLLVRTEGGESMPSADRGGARATATADRLVGVAPSP
jgi:hypothetical protein